LNHGNCEKEESETHFTLRPDKQQCPPFASPIELAPAIEDARFRVFDIDSGVVMDIRTLDSQMPSDQQRYATLMSEQQQHCTEKALSQVPVSTSANNKQWTKHHLSVPPRPASSPELEEEALDEAGVISSPTSVVHTVQVIYNEIRARFEGLEGLSPEWRSMNIQFGLDYNAAPKTVVPGYDFRIPAMLELMKRTLFRHEGHKTDGIFRLAPDKEECNYVKSLLNNGLFEDCDDPHVIANLIKVYFREMPGEGLLNGFDQPTILRIIDLPIPDIALELMSMKEPNKSLLYWVLDLMAEVVQFECLNRMSVMNMAIVWAPNLLRVDTSHKNAVQAVLLSQKATELLTKLLECTIITRCQHRELIYDTPNLV